ncbi:MAG: site-specific integrase [Phascolarctobacterium sp.]|nr:site-specific integrase [Phascolarctobacterium sp.]
MPGSKIPLDREAANAKRDCKWRLSVSNKFRPDGKPNRATKTIGPCSEAQAEKELQKFYVAFQNQSPSSGKKITFANFVEVWKVEHVAGLSPNTKQGHLSCADTRLLPYFGRMRLAKIKAETIIDFINDMKLNGERLDGKAGSITPGSIYDFYKILRSIFNKAVEWGYLSVSPCDSIPKDKRPKANYTAKPILEEVELGKLLTELFKLKPTLTNVKNQLFFYLSLIDGCRSGEHLALTWDDINFTGKKITISKNIYAEGSKTLTRNTTKGGTSRIVYCDDLCIELLKKHKAYQNEYLKKNGLSNPNKYVFLKRKRTGDDMVVELPSRSSFNHWMTKFLKKLDLPHIDVHSFRRMTASYCQDNQVPLTVIQQMLGHKNPNTTMIYLRSLSNAKLKGVEALSNTYQQLIHNDIEPNSNNL